MHSCNPRSTPCKTLKTLGFLKYRRPATRHSRGARRLGIRQSVPTAGRHYEAVAPNNNQNAALLANR